MLAEFSPREHLRIEFSTDQAPLEFSFAHDQGETAVNAVPGTNTIGVFPRSHGTMKFFAGSRFRMVAVHMSPAFFHRYLKEDKALESMFPIGLTSKKMCRGFHKPSA